jgi:hypothetical protein
MSAHCNACGVGFNITDRAQTDAEDVCVDCDGDDRTPSRVSTHPHPMRHGRPYGDEDWYINPNSPMSYHHY